MGIIEIRNVSLSLDGKKILNNLSMDIWEGHIHAIVGPNGAGKSTLAYTIMGLSGYRNFEGDILFDGISIKDKNIDERARLGITLAWQEPARFEGLTVRNFIRAAAKDKNEDAIESTLNKVGLSGEYLNRAVDHTLSGGERKKIELASILAMEPRVVLLDEPDSGIDVESLERIFDALKFFKNAGATVVMITHSPTVLQHAEHAFLLCHGEVVKKDVTRNIMPFFSDKCMPCDHINKPTVDEVRAQV